jgi:hypothetical protein
MCKSFPPDAVCKLHEVDTGNVQKDIEKYLREALLELKGEPDLALPSQRVGDHCHEIHSPLHSPRSVAEKRSHLQSMLNPTPFPSLLIVVNDF